nr:hypothetical protein [uncultured Roseateles sp.]
MGKAAAAGRRAGTWPAAGAVVAWLGLLGLPWASALAAPATLRLCTADVPFYPYTMPDGSGLSQQLVGMALRGLPLQLQNHRAPRARCLQDSRSGQADALIGVFSAERLQWLSYPMKGSQPDAAAGLAQLRFMVYRRSGATADWDGKRFYQLDHGAIGVQFGFSYGLELARLGVPLDDKAPSAEQVLRKLDRGRIPLAILQEEQAQALIDTAFAGRIETLPHPFMQQTLYLIVTREFQARNPALVAQLWAAIASLRNSPEYEHLRVAKPRPLGPQ